MFNVFKQCHILIELFLHPHLPPPAPPTELISSPFPPLAISETPHKPHQDSNPGLLASNPSFLPLPHTAGLSPLPGTDLLSQMRGLRSGVCPRPHSSWGTAGLQTLSSGVPSLDPMVYNVLLNGRAGFTKMCPLPFSGDAENLAMLCPQEIGIWSGICRQAGSAARNELRDLCFGHVYFGS